MKTKVVLFSGLILLCILAIIIFKYKHKIYEYTEDKNEITITGLTDYERTQTKLKIPKYIKGHKVTSIGHRAFAECGLIEEVEIPDSVHVIEGAAFAECKNLKCVNMLGCADIENMAFSRCESLEEFYINEGQISIGSGSFYSTGLLNIDEMLKYVENLGESSFLGCNKIKEIIIPNNVKTIQAQAFGDCTLLKEIVIPSSVEEIGDDIFRNIKSDVTIITSSGSVAEQYAIDNNIAYSISKEL